MIKSSPQSGKRGILYPVSIGILLVLIGLTACHFAVQLLTDRKEEQPPPASGETALSLEWTAADTPYGGTLVTGADGTVRLTAETPERIAGLSFLFDPASGECRTEWKGHSLTLSEADLPQHMGRLVAEAVSGLTGGDFSAAGPLSEVSGKIGGKSCILTVNRRGIPERLSVPDLSLNVIFTEPV